MSYRPICSILLTLLVAGPVGAATYYVAPNGSNGNNGLSRGAAWQTLQFASLRLKAGDTLMVAGGQYSNSVAAGQSLLAPGSGSPGNPITIQAIPGETPVLTGPALYGSYVSTTGSWLIFDGLHFENATNSTVVMALTNSSNVIVRNCRFFNTPGTAIRLLSVTAHTIEKNYFDTAGSPANVGTEDHIYVNGSDHVLIQDNYFTKAGHAAIDLIDDGMSPSHHCVIRRNRIEQHWGGGIYVIRLSHHNVVEDNFIAYAGEGVTGYPKAGLHIASDNNIVRRNIVTKTSASPYADAGLVLEAYNFQSRLQTCRYNRFYNNVVYKSGREAVQLIQKHNLELTENIFKNNVFYANRVAGPANPYHASGNDYLFFETYHSPNLQWNDFPHRNIFDTNVILHGDAAGDYPAEPRIIFYQTATAGTAYSLATAQAGFSQGFLNNLTTNPGFVDAEGGDFRLLPNSALIDQGVSLTQVRLTGSSNIIPVVDPLYFSDGFGLVPGDSIIVGQNYAVQVTAVDELAKTLTVSSNISFKVGDPVNYAYQGNGPDLGATEIQGSGTAPAAIQTAAPLQPRVFPNPWRSDRHTSASQVTFDQLTTGCVVKIFTISGHLVRELPKADSVVVWDLKGEKGDRVSSGIYLYSISDAAGRRAKGKLAIVR